ncbi:uncharacterized protein LOC131206335 [Anopheles bellator]|uniref:uncharacterized protein LOC131206335 n=1 Tax=Anopheles bellator TaxID=139047 RepID=UPI002647774B|nr:uncharacterized protein LOC131206335 [Anopheles bellator]
MEERALESLGRLTKLKNLKLDGFMRLHSFRRCKAVASLVSVHLKSVYFHDPLEFFHTLFRVAPQLCRLNIQFSIVDDEVLHFICYHFACLQSLTLESCRELTGEGLANIDQLAELRHFQLSFLNISERMFECIPRNTVRYLSIICCDRTMDDGLRKIPGKFPLLRRLTIRKCPLVTNDCMERLRMLMPSCTFVKNGQHFYPAYVGL